MSISRDRSLSADRPTPGSPSSVPAGLAGPARTALVALLALGPLLASCGGDADANLAGQAEGGAVAGTPATPAPGNGGVQRIINVEVETIAPSDFREEIRLTGVVRAARDVTLSAEESGVIREVIVERGRTVAQGAPLFRIDDRILATQLREADARAGLAAENWERRRRLFEEDGVGSELQYLEARFQLEQAEATAETLRERVNRSVIRAPFAGVLEDRMVEVGTSVAPGSPVARLVQVNPVKVSAGVPERLSGEVRVGSPARISFDVLPGQVFEGQVSYVGATVNARNRTFEAEVVLPNPGGIAKPEMVANVEILREVREGVVVVPRNAVVRTEEGFVAFVVEGWADGTQADAGGTARVRTLELGPTQRDRVLVLAGLEPGDLLVVVGQQQVADGDRVRVVRSRGGDR
jgi:membrane fusion protein, multidrug efflux system